jgi:MoaA/NifB/PqqE/SkfB family radical SAM enzyme
MSLDTFHKALQIAFDYDEYLTIGGGEPTIHPHFERILLEAIAKMDENHVVIITNGKHTKRALMLASLAKKHIICAELSTDQYHEEIDAVVMDAFEGRYRDNEKSRRGRMILTGRFKETMFLTQDSIPQNEDCCCEDWIVKPDGTIKQCGCEDSPIIGNVTDGIKQPCLSGICYRSEEYSKEYSKCA